MAVPASVTLPAERPFAGQHVAVLGKGGVLSRRDLRALVERLGGTCAFSISDHTTIIIRTGDVLAEGWPAHVREVLTEDALCLAAGLPDLEAMAHAVPVLEPEELAVLQAGVPVPSGNAALIAAGTGLGQALLHNVRGEFVPSASEGGHCDFAARTARELALVEHLTAIYGRVDNDRVISGPGLTNLFRFTHGFRAGSGTCRAIGPDVENGELPAAISATAMSGRCEQCAEALDMFVEAYGAEAGNLALRSVATAGLYIGGGIAPKILPALERGLFLDAFRAKDPLTDLLRTIPVSVILNPAAGLLGAAVGATARF